MRKTKLELREAIGLPDRTVTRVTNASSLWQRHRNGCNLCGFCYNPCLADKAAAPTRCEQYLAVPDQLAPTRLPRIARSTSRTPDMQATRAVAKTFAEDGLKVLCALKYFLKSYSDLG